MKIMETALRNTIVKTKMMKREKDEPKTDRDSPEKREEKICVGEGRFIFGHSDLKAKT